MLRFAAHLVLALRALGALSFRPGDDPRSLSLQQRNQLALCDHLVASYVEALLAVRQYGLAVLYSCHLGADMRERAFASLVQGLAAAGAPDDECFEAYSQAAGIMGDWYARQEASAAVAAAATAGPSEEDPVAGLFGDVRPNEAWLLTQLVVQRATASTLAGPGRRAALCRWLMFPHLLAQAEADAAAAGDAAAAADVRPGLEEYAAALEQLNAVATSLALGDRNCGAAGAELVDAVLAPDFTACARALAHELQTDGAALRREALQFWRSDGPEALAGMAALAEAVRSGADQLDGWRAYFLLDRRYRQWAQRYAAAPRPAGGGDGGASTSGGGGAATAAAEPTGAEAAALVEAGEALMEALLRPVRDCCRCSCGRAPLLACGARSPRPYSASLPRFSDTTRSSPPMPPPLHPQLYTLAQLSGGWMGGLSGPPLDAEGSPPGVRLVLTRHPKGPGAAAALAAAAAEDAFPGLRDSVALASLAASLRDALESEARAAPELAVRVTLGEPASPCVQVELTPVAGASRGAALLAAADLAVNLLKGALPAAPRVTAIAVDAPASLLLELARSVCLVRLARRTMRVQLRCAAMGGGFSAGARLVDWVAGGRGDGTLLARCSPGDAQQLVRWAAAALEHVYERAGVPGEGAQ